VTAWRTGLAAALGTHVLAGPADGSGPRVIGAGAQAELTVAGARRPAVLRRTRRPRHGRRPRGRVRRTARRPGAAPRRRRSPRPPMSSCCDLVPHTAAVPRGTPVRTALHQPGRRRAGKRELAADLLDAALLVVDDVNWPRPWACCPERHRRHARRRPARRPPGTRRRRERSVYAPVGLPWQDLALARLAYERRSGTGVGGGWICWVSRPCATVLPAHVRFRRSGSALTVGFGRAT